MFLVPIPQGESFTTLLDFLKSWIKGLFGGSLSYIIVVILIVSAIMSTYDYFVKPEWIRKNHYLTRAFTTTPLYLVSKIIGAVFAVMVVFKIGPEVMPCIHAHLEHRPYAHIPHLSQQSRRISQQAHRWLSTLLL